MKDRPDMAFKDVSELWWGWDRLVYNPEYETVYFQDATKELHENDGEFLLYGE